MNYKRLKMVACWSNNWDISYSPKSKKIKFIIQHKYFDDVRDVVRKVEDKTQVDIKDISEMHFTYKSTNWIMIFVGNINYDFVTINVYGYDNKPTSFEIYDVDGDILKNGQI